MFSKADLTSCRHCGKPVRWTVSEAGRPFGVDPDPDPAGNTAVMRDAPGTLRSPASRPPARCWAMSV